MGVGVGLYELLDKVKIKKLCPVGGLGAGGGWRGELSGINGVRSAGRGPNCISESVIRPYQTIPGILFVQTELYWQSEGQARGAGYSLYTEAPLCSQFPGLFLANPEPVCQSFRSSLFMDAVFFDNTCEVGFRSSCNRPCPAAG